MLGNTVCIKYQLKTVYLVALKNDYSLDNGKSYLIVVMNRYSFIDPPEKGRIYFAKRKI